MSEPIEKPGRGYTRILLEFAAIIIALSVFGGFLTVEHASLGITDFYARVVGLMLLALGVGTILALIHGPMKHTMESRGGPHFASAFSFFATLITLVAGFIALLATLSIPASAFLVAVGGIGIVAGFAVSTITTNVISGAFMLTSFPIKIGQRIVITVNNQPGTITGVSTLFMTVTTDAGARLIIPNAAIFQGAAFLLDIGHSEKASGSDQLLAEPGDRVISTLFPYPATVTEVTELMTKITTDGGQVLSIPNQAILNGASALVKIRTPEVGLSKLPVALGDQVRLSSGFTGKVTELGPYYFRVTSGEEEAVIPIGSLTSGAVTVFRKKTT